MKYDLLKEQYNDELNLKLASIKFVMERINNATMKWSKEECEKQVHQVKLGESEKYDLIRKAYDSRIDDLHHQIDSCKSELEMQKNAQKTEQLDLTLQSIDNDLSTYCDINLGAGESLFCESSSNFNINSNVTSSLLSQHQFQPITHQQQLKKLLSEIEDKNGIIKSMKKSEENYLEEIQSLKTQLSQFKADLDVNSATLNCEIMLRGSKKTDNNNSIKSEILFMNDKDDLINLDSSSSDDSTSKSLSSNTSSASSSSNLSSKSESGSSSVSSSSASTNSSSNSSSASSSSSRSSERFVKIKEETESENELDLTATEEKTVQDEQHETSILNNSRSSTDLGFSGADGADISKSLKNLLDEKDKLIQQLNSELIKFKSSDDLDLADNEEYKAKYFELKDGIFLFKL